MTDSSSVLVTSRALWDARPTTGKRSERFLANALGYPRSWRVVRRRKVKDDTANANANDNATTEGASVLIVDRIYAGPPEEGVDVYLNHMAAQRAAAEWEEGVSTGKEHKGGQLLPRKAKFRKGDNVKVLYDDQWCLATIKKSFQKKDGTFRYSVYYPEDGTTQSQVPEADIQLVQVDALLEDPQAVAEELGFGEGWQAQCAPGGKKKKWTFVSPDGKTFTSKASALKHQKNLEKGITTTSTTTSTTDKEPKNRKKTKEDLLTDEGDPPWRTTGHPYIGRQVLITTSHKKSATRTVEIEQVGTVLGWIAATDVDQHGDPGFVSDKTNEPANLFHVVFDEETSHPYFSLLVESQDLEEYELQNVLVPLTLEEEEEQQKAAMGGGGGGGGGDVAAAAAAAVDGKAAAADGKATGTDNTKAEEGAGDADNTKSEGVENAGDDQKEKE